jgi:hypothetical protein
MSGSQDGRSQTVVESRHSVAYSRSSLKSIVRDCFETVAVSPELSALKYFLGIARSAGFPISGFDEYALMATL